jgi:hypothetical protein
MAPERTSPRAVPKAARPVPSQRQTLNEEMRQVGTNRFVRSAESRGWVHEGDLPLEKGRAMYDRIKREYAQWQALQSG